MKKLSLLIGTIGGATAGYLLSNKKLREQLTNAKDPEEAARLLGQHLQKDGKKLAKQLQEFVESDEVQSNINKAKGYAKQKVDEAKVEMKELMTTGTKKATTAAKSGAKKAKSTAAKTTKKATTAARKTAKKAKKRVKAKVRAI